MAKPPKSRLAARRLGAALTLLALGGGVAQAARLRAIVTLDGPVVRLSDLFRDAGPNAARVLGPGPAPGARIVVPAPQLAAIARDYDVAWRPLSPADQVVIERPGTPLHRAALLAALRPALAAAGAPAHFTIALAHFSAPMVPPGAKVRIAVESLSFDRAGGGRFAATLAIFAPGMTPVEAALAGLVEIEVRVPVALRQIAAGSLIGPGDVALRPVASSLAGPGTIVALGQALGFEARRTLAPGRTIRAADLAPPTLVRKGAAVVLRLRSGGLTLTAQGIALGSGGAGEVVQVLNPISHAILLAVVTGPHRLRVAPGSMPLMGTGTGMIMAAR